MSDEQKLIFTIAILRRLAMSDRERLDRYDTPVYVYADQALQYIGEDVESIPASIDEMREFIMAFNHWRRGMGMLP